MRLSEILVGALTCVPTFGRLVVREYLRRGWPVPRRAEWIVMVLTNKLAPLESMQEVTLKGGLRLKLNPQSTVGKEIYFKGSYEPQLVKLLGSLLRPGMVFLDAGANIGELTVRAARLVGPQGRVLAVEASPETAKNLKTNVGLNRLRNVKVLCAAVSDMDGPMTFFLWPDADSLASSLSAPDDFAGRSVTVTGVTLDTLLLREGVARVDVLKIDVEGAEMAVFRGAAKLLAGDHPPILIFEYNKEVAERVGWNLGRAIDLLAKFGYSVRPITDRGVGSVLDPAENHEGSASLKRDFIASRQRLPKQVLKASR